jgi:hypothetical protein
MPEIILSLRHAYQTEEIDLEVDPDQTLRGCVETVAVLKGWLTPALLSTTAYTLEAAPGRNLPLDLTFQQARVWSGAALVFHPPGGAPKENIHKQPTRPANDANGYQFIRLD